MIYKRELEDFQKIVWENKYKKYCIIYDDMLGFMIDDGFYLFKPCVYYDLRVAYDNPFILPKYIKDKFEQLVLKGVITP